MAWLYIKLPHGTLKIKPRAQLRTVEQTHQVPVLDLGIVVITWWNRAQLRRDAQDRANNRKGEWTW